MPYVDLHLHTHYSDGSDSPAYVVDRAAALGIAAIAITDHDTTGGVGEGAAHAATLGVSFLSGVEISADFQNQETHILAYGIDTASPALCAVLEENQNARIQRSRAILERLKELGVVLSVEAKEGAAPGRMHIAQALVESGATKTVQEGFDRFLRFGKSAYVGRKNADMETVLRAIHSAGGLAFLAHPGLNKGLRKRVPALLEQPLDGIEAYHSAHSPGDTEAYLQLAKTRGLLVSGGSDCHGAAKGGKGLLGTVQTPVHHYEALLEKLGR